MARLAVTRNEKDPDANVLRLLKSTQIEQQRRQFERPNAFEAPGEVLIGLGQSRATKQL